MQSSLDQFMKEDEQIKELDKKLELAVIKVMLLFIGVDLSNHVHEQMGWMYSLPEFILLSSIIIREMYRSLSLLIARFSVTEKDN